MFFIRISGLDILFGLLAIESLIVSPPLRSFFVIERPRIIFGDAILRIGDDA